MKYESKIGKAGGSGPSSKTTIPKPLMKLLGLEIGDKLEWVVEIDNNETHISIIPKKV